RAVVTTSTDAVLERLIFRAAQRNSLKTRLGIADNKPVVLFMSTWGRPSLMSTHGEELAREAEFLREDFQLIFSVHPKLIGSRRTQSVLTTLKAKGAKVIPPVISWVDIRDGRPQVDMKRTTGLLSAIPRRVLSEFIC